MVLEPVRAQLQPRDPSSCLSPGLGLFFPPLPPDSLLSPLCKSSLEGNGQCPSSEKENPLWSTSPSVRVPFCPLPFVTKLYGKCINTSYLCLLMTHPRTFQFGFCLQHHEIGPTGSYHFSKSIWLFFFSWGYSDFQQHLTQVCYQFFSKHSPLLGFPSLSTLATVLTRHVLLLLINLYCEICKFQGPDPRLSLHSVYFPFGYFIHSSGIKYHQ